METKVKEIIQDVLCLDKEVSDKIQYNQELYDFGLDSINAIEMIVLIESTFNISIDDDDLIVDNLASIENAVELIKKYI